MTPRKKRRSDTFYVNKIIDIKWEYVDGIEIPKYRVRWVGFSVDADTWEPAESFDNSQLMLTSFLQYYEEMREEKRKYLHARGQEITEDELRKVNVLSREIVKIIKKKDRSPNVQYLVQWDSEENCYWVHESHLVHAQDKVDAFLHRIRVKKVQCKSKAKASNGNLDSKRRKKEREFYKKIEERDPSILENDMYTLVKTGRQNRDTSPQPSTSSAGNESNSQGTRRQSKKNTSSPTSTAISKKKRMLKKNAATNMSSSEEETIANNTSISISSSSGINELSFEEELQSEEPTSENETPLSFLAGLPQFDPDRSDMEYLRLERQILELSKEDFEAAIDNDDYQTLLAAMRSNNIPDVDFDRLFLKAARRGGRDVALLLSTCVSDLSIRDDYGNSAICMAAERGDICFAYHLFQMNVPKTTLNGVQETLMQIASKSNNMHFIKFLREYKK